LPKNPIFTLLGHHVFGKYGDKLVTLNTPQDITSPQPSSSSAKPGDVCYAEAALEDRSAQRKKLKIPAILRPSGSEGFNVTILDISLSGFSAEALTRQPNGTRVWIKIPGLTPLQAEIARNDGTVVGCAFANLLNQAVLDNLVARYRLDE